MNLQLLGEWKSESDRETTSHHLLLTFGNAYFIVLIIHNRSLDLIEDQNPKTPKPQNPIMKNHNKKVCFIFGFLVIWRRYK